MRTFSLSSITLAMSSSNEKSYRYPLQMTEDFFLPSWCYMTHSVPH